MSNFDTVTSGTINSIIYWHPRTKLHLGPKWSPCKSCGATGLCQHCGGYGLVQPSNTKDNGKENPEA